MKSSSPSPRMLKHLAVIGESLLRVALTRAHSLHRTLTVKMAPDTIKAAPNAVKMAPRLNNTLTSALPHIYWLEIEPSVLGGTPPSLKRNYNAE